MNPWNVARRVCARSTGRDPLVACFRSSAGVALAHGNDHRSIRQDLNGDHQGSDTEKPHQIPRGLESHAGLVGLICRSGLDLREWTMLEFGVSAAVKEIESAVQVHDPTAGFEFGP